MQLRKNIKPPRRYEEYQQPNDDDVEKEVFHSPPKPSTRAAYRGKIIEFDPSLPPAVFPTTDLWWSGKADVKGSSASRPNSSIAVPQTSDPRKSQTNSQVPASQKQRTKPTNPPQSILHSIMPQSRSPPKYIAYRCQSPDLLKDLPTEVEEVDDGIWSNGQANPIYVDNLKIMEKLGARTNDDLELLEMETSDEEDRLQNSKSVQKADTRVEDTPAWEQLSAAHQVDLVMTLSEVCETTEVAIQQLRLNAVQAQDVLRLLKQHQGQEAIEKARVAKLQDETNRLLIGDDIGMRHISQAKYRQLFEKHLYKPCVEDFDISTVAEFAKAKLYLQSCGYHHRLLDHWKTGSNGVGKGSAKSTVRKPVIKLHMRTQPNPALQSQSSTPSQPAAVRPGRFIQIQSSSQTQQSPANTESQAKRSQTFHTTDILTPAVPLLPGPNMIQTATPAPSPSFPPSMTSQSVTDIGKPDMLKNLTRKLPTPVATPITDHFGTHPASPIKCHQTPDLRPSNAQGAPSVHVEAAKTKRKARNRVIIATSISTTVTGTTADVEVATPITPKASATSQTQLKLAPNSISGGDGKGAKKVRGDGVAATKN